MQPLSFASSFEASSRGCTDPDWFAVAENLQFWKENKVIGYMAEASTVYPPGADLHELKTYVTSRLLWNSSRVPTSTKSARRPQTQVLTPYGQSSSANHTSIHFSRKMAYEKSRSAGQMAYCGC